MPSAGHALVLSALRAAANKVAELSRTIGNYQYIDNMMSF
jgi:hypothetical protein